MWPIQSLGRLTPFTKRTNFVSKELSYWVAGKRALNPIKQYHNGGWFDGKQWHPIPPRRQGHLWNMQNALKQSRLSNICRLPADFRDTFPPHVSILRWTKVVMITAWYIGKHWFFNYRIAIIIVWRINEVLSLYNYQHFTKSSPFLRRADTIEYWLLEDTPVHR